MKKIFRFRIRSFLIAMCLGILWLPQNGMAQIIHLSTLQDLLDYADAHSAVYQGAQVQSELARLQTAAAIANTVNLRGAASFSLTDNYALPVNFLPAEIFGGPAGTFRQVTFGQQFVNVASIAPQLDIINPSTWARVGSAKASAELTQVTNALNRRSLHENIAVTYCNARSIAAQWLTTTRNLENADEIVEMVRRRYEEGLVRKQDLNNALVNRTNLEEFLQALGTKKEQALLTLATLVGLPQGQHLQFAGNDSRVSPPPTSRLATSQLQLRQAALQVDLQRSELRANRLAFLPTVSVVAGFNWQQNSNEAVFNSAIWIKSQYVGLKMSVPLPTETRLWSQAEEYRINLKMKEINAQQVARQEAIQNEQLNLELERATQAIDNAKIIEKYKLENHEAAMRNYHEGLITEDVLINAFVDWFNAGLAVVTAEWNQYLQLAKLRLNQEIGNE